MAVILKFIPGGRATKKVDFLKSEVIDLWSAEIDLAITKYREVIERRNLLGLPPSGFLYRPSPESGLDSDSGQ